MKKASASKGLKNKKITILDKKLFFIGIAISLVLMAADLWSKYYIFSVLESIGDYHNPVIEVTSFFNLVKVWNNGVSFGMFNSLENAQIILSAVNIIITFILLVWLFRNNSKYLMVAISFIIGGALGNLIDRIINGAVADFLDFHVVGYHWPAFNLADSFVFIGVVLLLFENFFIKKDEK